MTIRRDRPAGTPLIPITLRWGVILAFAVALISGVSVFVNGFAVKQLPDAAVYTTLKNGVAALILIVVALAVVPRAQVRALDRRSWSAMLVIGVIGGSVPFVLFFSGLAIASAPTAAFIHKTLFIWVVLLAVPFLGERLGWFPIAALGVLLAGQFLAAPPTGVDVGHGRDDDPGRDAPVGGRGRHRAAAAARLGAVAGPRRRPARHRPGRPRRAIWA